MLTLRAPKASMQEPRITGPKTSGSMRYRQTEREIILGGMS